MKCLKTILLTSVAVVAYLVAVSTLTGCSTFTSPTSASTQADYSPDKWNPQSGDQVVPGRDVPLLSEGYWENLYGDMINPADDEVSVVIGPEGGMLRLGRHRLQVPDGAVSEPVTFTMRYASNTGVGVDCFPSPFRFNRPVRLILSYDGTQYDGAQNVPNLQVIYLTPEGDALPLPSQMDRRSNQVMAELDHFSRYIVG